ncbi:TPA: TonB-dependent receptor [Mannheimia haemolytica]|uniref:Heme/hemopexin utilization protein C n=1 Tax=Mannheimia haemolytica TaxID=75985 RepID=A0A378NK57_MANHA|nr:TonB-dependent receptor [Mannheimia haemolytica]AGQ38933.1 membrane protein [Mannheimia haemolytica D171]EEY11259.1 ferric enterobactin receptor [Mannheimia haemolytica serotype A2 str. OVINE]KYL11479.1 FetA [Mannheimia haemolytica]KYL14733.1 FetA [Mannheimia haemolytica]KYL24703.1 FetA [Mannheimia haemolytica]
MKNFKLLPVSAAVLSVLAANAFAETVATDAAVLDTVTVTDNQGLKVQTNVVTTQKKEESTQTDLRGLLKDEPAISLGGGNGTSQYLYIRGMGQNSIDVKVDNTYSDSQILYHQGRHMLDPALVGTVTVQKGAGSASAGIGQTNGAVIAKTVDALDLLKNSDKNFGAKLGTGFSTNHAHNFNATLYGKGEIFDALVSGNLVRDRDYKGGKDYVNQFGTNRVPYSALDKSSFLAKLGATLGDHRFVLSHSNERNEGERLVREEFDAAPVGTKGSRVTLDRQAPANRRMTVQRTNLEWTGKNLGFAQEATANVYQLVQGRWSENETRNGYAGGVDYATKTKIVTHGANVNFDSALHENVLLKYGVNYRHQETKPYAKFSHQLVNQEKTDTGVYLEAITAPVDKVTLTTGVRYDHFKFKAMDGKKRSEGAFNPSVGIIYEPIQHLSFSASHNYATRSPRMHDALLSHGRRGVVSIANNTKAEQARSTEIGFNYNDGTFSFDGSYFWQNIKDALGTSTGRNNHLCPELTPNTNNKECYSEIINAGTIKNRGYELNAGYHNNGFTARVGVAHSKPRFQGDRLSTNPEYASAIGRTWTASLSYRFDQPNLEVGVHHRIIEKVKAEDNYFVMNNNGIPQFGRGGPTGKDGYNVTDITLNWKPLNDDSVNVNFAVDNVANKKYNAHGQRGQLSARGREFRAGVNYTF